eukprot:1157750-Pelagomonas_calceolata.AAC.1
MQCFIRIYSDTKSSAYTITWVWISLSSTVTLQELHFPLPQLKYQRMKLICYYQYIHDLDLAFHQVLGTFPLVADNPKVCSLLLSEAKSTVALFIISWKHVKAVCVPAAAEKAAGISKEHRGRGRRLARGSC